MLRTKASTILPRLLSSGSRNASTASTVIPGIPPAAQSTKQPATYMSWSMPDISLQPAQPRPQIPYLPDFWESSTAKNASAVVEEALPKLSVVSELDTVHSHNLYTEESPDTVSAPPRNFGKGGLLQDMSEDMGIPISLHVQTTTLVYDRVGPSHPISNMRAIIYDEHTPPSKSRFHPYSLHEFDPRQTSPYDLQWKLQRQQLDEFHHAFWLEAPKSNTRFERGKDEALSRLPPTATPLDKERALSEFYRHWVVQEERRTGAYTDEWRQRNMASIILAFRVACSKFTTRFSDIVMFRSNKSA
ncbi:hypothetical protein C8R46DRAFT_1259165 [Mycena filopes]|nr:hypothetical protein C8R46DRAFT_1259165 [Mycena filopes]